MNFLKGLLGALKPDQNTMAVGGSGLAAFLLEQGVTLLCAAQHICFTLSAAQEASIVGGVMYVVSHFMPVSDQDLLKDADRILRLAQEIKVERANVPRPSAK